MNSPAVIAKQLFGQGRARDKEEPIHDQDVFRPFSISSLADLHRAGAQPLFEFTRLAYRLSNGGFVVIVESQRAIHCRQRYAVVLGRCLRAIVQSQVRYQIGIVMGPGDGRIQRVISI